MPDALNIEVGIGNLFDKSLDQAIKCLNPGSKNLYSTSSVALVSEFQLGNGPSVQAAKKLLSAIDKPRGPKHWAIEFAQSNERDVDLLRRLLEANKIILSSMGMGCD